MPTIQSSYAATLPIAVIGAFADTRSREVVSRELESATLGFGALVFRGTKDHTCAGLGGSGGFLGLAAMDPTVPASNAGNLYLQSQTVAVMRKGIMWVIAASSCSPGAAVYYDASGNYTVTSAGNTALPGATFESTANAGGLAQLRLS